MRASFRETGAPNSILGTPSASRLAPKKFWNRLGRNKHFVRSDKKLDPTAELISWTIKHGRILVYRRNIIFTAH